MDTLTTPPGMPGLRARLSRHGDQADLARRLGWPRARLNRYLTGQRQPRTDAARQIARALGCTIDDLLSCENTA